MRNPSVTIDPASEIPVRRQILDQMRSALVNGSLAPGDELPSVRRLAMDLGIHFNTVAEVYRMLADEGWLDVSHGRAARVIKRDKPMPPDNDAVDRFRQRLRHLIAEMRASGFTPVRIAKELFSATEEMK